MPDPKTPILQNDFRRQWLDLGRDVEAAVSAVGESGWYVLGPEVSQFEEALAAHWTPLSHAIGVASGLDALEISLRLAGLEPGERVLTTPLSAFATTLAIVRAGGKPVFCDTDAAGLIDLDEAAAVLYPSPPIRFFVPVALYGRPLDPGRLAALRDRFDLTIIEDCAQSIGADWAGQPTGTSGLLAATSFYPTKNLGALGDGGAILTRSPELAERARRLRDYGQSAKYVHAEMGWNSRLDELQAAILRRAFLPRLAGWTARRQAIAAQYRAGIRHEQVICPPEPPGSHGNGHLFPVLVPPAAREAFEGWLAAAGIRTGRHYPAVIPDQPAMAGIEWEIWGDLERARRIAASTVSLPVHPYLTGAEAEAVIAAVNAWPGTGKRRGAG